jgi:hypothetical protein
VAPLDAAAAVDRWDHILEQEVAHTQLVGTQLVVGNQDAVGTQLVVGHSQAAADIGLDSLGVAHTKKAVEDILLVVHSLPELAGTQVADDLEPHKHHNQVLEDSQVQVADDVAEVHRKERKPPRTPGFAAF